MNHLETLKELESFYNTYYPAEENSNLGFIWFTDIPHPLFNAVMHLSCNQNLAKTVDKIIGQAPKGLPLSFWLHPQNNAEGLEQVLKDRGFQSMLVCHLMTWNGETVVASRHDIRAANPQTFYEILGITFSLDAVVKKKYALMNEKNKIAEDFEIYTEGKAVGTGTLICRGNRAAIFNISTLPLYQKRGYGSALMLFLMHRAVALGAKKIVLLSSPSAKKMYEGLGFETAFDVELLTR